MCPTGTPPSTLERVHVALQERLLPLGGERPVHRLARVRQPQREQEAPWSSPRRSIDPQVGEVDLGLARRARGSAARTPPPATGPPRPRSPAAAWRRSPAPSSTTSRSASCSSTSRASTRRAVCRCLRGASRSSQQHRVDQPPSTGSSFGAARTGVFRAGGTALPNACRTVRRCTRCRSASSRIDSPSTPLVTPDRLEQLHPRPRHFRPSRSPSTTRASTVRVGPDQTVTTAPACRRWGQIRPSQWGQIRLTGPALARRTTGAGPSGQRPRRRTHTTVRDHP